MNKTTSMDDSPGYSPEAMRKIVRIIERENRKVQAGRGDITKLVTAQMTYITALGRDPECPAQRILAGNVFDVFLFGGNIRLLEGGRSISFMPWPKWISESLREVVGECIQLHHTQRNETHHFAN